MSESESGVNPRETTFQDVAAALGAPTEPEQPTVAQPQDDVTPEPQDDTPQGDTPPERTVSVKLGDQDIQLQVLTENVDLEAIPKGLLMEADYRKKTSEVAEQRRANDARLTELDAALTEAKGLIESDLDTLEANVDLRESDPTEYLRQLDAIKLRISKHNEHKSKVDQEAANKLAQKQATEQQLLNAAIPDWLDEDRKSTDIQNMGTTLRAVGYQNEDIAEFNDHRMFLLALKAANYDQMMLKNLKSKQDTSPGKNLEPGTKQSTGNELSERAQSVRERFSKSGRFQDLAAVLSRPR